ncbi:MAG: hypothetical protein OSB25_06760 [Salibacteraceae bacterium]|nr:hypothetical protein [Salibacteraceae bacterium]|tara:strand:+ start:12299 stop:12622 length:324 start_codon:yes stop_codon:yes gene_type:complete
MSDNTNIPADSFGTAYWYDRVDSINHYLKNLSIANYFSYTGRQIDDSKLQVELYDIHYHVDAELYDQKWSNGTAMTDGDHNGLLQSRLVNNNSSISTFEKDQVLPLF